MSKVQAKSQGEYIGNPTWCMISSINMLTRKMKTPLREGAQNLQRPHVGHNLNSLNSGIILQYRGSVGLLKGDTRSSDLSSCARHDGSVGLESEGCVGRTQPTVGAESVMQSL